MTLADLPAKYHAQVLAFVEIASAERGDRSWGDIEPVLASCWQETHGTSDLKWDDIAPCVRSACNQNE